MVMTGGYLAMFFSVMLFFPCFGLLWLFIAQITQYSLVAFCSRLLLVRWSIVSYFVPSQFSAVVMREMLGYGLKLQAAGLASFLADPLTRLLINHFGSLAALANYELASKLVVQIRAIIVAGAMPMIPVFAVSKSLKDESSIRLMRQANRMVFVLSFLLLIAASFSAPLLGLVVLGIYDLDIVVYAVVLATGYSINTMALPLYLYSQAQGRLKWNIIGQFMIGVMTISISPLLSTFLGAMGVVLAFAVGLSIAGVIFIVANARQNQVGVRSLWLPAT